MKTNIYDKLQKLLEMLFAAKKNCCFLTQKMLLEIQEHAEE